MGSGGSKHMAMQPIQNKPIFIDAGEAEDEFNIYCEAGDDYPPPGPPKAEEVDAWETNFWPDSDWRKGGPNPEIDDDIPSLHNSTFDILNQSDDFGVNLSTFYYVVDHHAVKATREDVESFHALTSYLKEAIPEGSRFSERLLARAIVKWLSEQNVDGRSNGSANLDTPTGLLQYMREGRMTYATCYTILCRKAGLKALVIQGVAKSAEYQVGDIDVTNNEWTAVHVDGSWQIVQPLWVCEAVVGHSHGGWTKVESDGEAVSKPQVAAEGITMKIFQGQYFMPPPSVFVFICLAYNQLWQLLPRNSMIPSRDSFTKLPYLSSSFFGLQLKLVSEQKSVLHSEKGICIIKIQGNPKNAHRINLRYDLYVQNTSFGGNPMIQEKNIPRLVLQSRCKDLFTFQVRFPIEGVFKLEISGGPLGFDMLPLCEFMLVCEERLADCRLLPKQAGVEGWGPGPVAEINGLLLPSKQNGVVPVSPPKSPDHPSREIFRFQLSQRKASNSLYDAELIQGNDFEGEIEIQKIPVQCKLDMENTSLDVNAEIDKPGEYALVIVRTDRAESRTVACNYLLSTLVEPPRLKASQRIARQNLVEILNGNAAARLGEEIVSLENGIEKCRKQKLDESDDEMAVAVTRLEYLKTKKEIEDCIRRRHLEVTVKTLKHLMSYRYRSAISTDVMRVHNLMEELLALHGYTMPIPSIGSAVKELHYLVNPKNEVKEIVRAFLLLLGYAVDYDDDWATFQVYLAPCQVLAQINNLNPHELGAHRRREAGRIVAGYTEERVRHVSQSAARILCWLTETIKEAEGTPEIPGSSHPET